MPQHAAEQDLRREMVDYIEARLKVRPYQWHFIANLDTYYHIPFSRIQAVYKKNQAQFLRLNAKYSHASKNHDKEHSTLYFFRRALWLFTFT
ncbi:hypothetical protein VRC02_09760 [Erwinia sp. E_sp_B01_3]|uniref:hypothetical protein n=1 Tax=Erwinia sp. E_sp_B01_3 TaxID=3039402 RepID=UPI0030D3B40A